LVTATEDGKVRIWDIPEQGLQSDLLDPSDSFQAHSSKVTFLLFHPLASDILMTVSPELGSACVKVWNVKTKELISTLQHPDQVSLNYSSSVNPYLNIEKVLGATFSNDGKLVATTARDKKLRLFDALTGKLLQVGIFAYFCTSLKSILIF
jgi:coronin-7